MVESCEKCTCKLAVCKGPVCVTVFIVDTCIRSTKGNVTFEREILLFK